MKRLNRAIAALAVFAAVLFVLSGCKKSEDKIKVKMDVRDYGTIYLELYPDEAPITVANFVKLANEHFYDGLTFHRIISGFMIQGGDPEHNGMGGSDENIKGEFKLNGVENNISNITFRLKQGQTLGIIGATGSGKTTLTNLLLRLYDVTSGTIYIDGQDIRSLDPATLSDQTGIAFQSDFIMAATIRDNVAYFRDISDEDIWQALRTAQAEEFVRATADGLLHQVESRGNNLSGGQKQRLLIARALANKPRLLILDDASSALDYRTDAALRRDLSQQHQNTTSIIIAQRVSSIKGADQILVLEDGRAIGQGTHDELMRTCDTYRDIAQVQMGARQLDVPEQEVG